MKCETLHSAVLEHHFCGCSLCGEAPQVQWRCFCLGGLWLVCCSDEWMGVKRALSCSCCYFCKILCPRCSSTLLFIMNFFVKYFSTKTLTSTYPHLRQQNANLEYTDQGKTFTINKSPIHQPHGTPWTDMISFYHQFWRPYCCWY